MPFSRAFEQQRPHDQGNTGVPTQLHAISVWISPLGARFTLRAVEPRDAGPLGELFHRLGPMARFNRFQGRMANPSAPTLARMTGIDHRREVALVVAVREAHRDVIIAEARYAMDDDGIGAEFAIVVDEHWQRHGLGERLMQALMQAAGNAHLQWLHGSVWASNKAMLALLRRCRFCCTPDPEDDQMLHAEIRLQALWVVTADRASQAARRLPLLARWRSAGRSFTGL
jgi:acetyltransferase